MEQVDVKILDREYRLAVSPDDKARLLEAVGVVDEKMRSIRAAGKVSGLERVAVMAALQLAHELLGAATGGARPSAEAAQRIRKMSEDIEAEIQRQQQSLF
jgi:cell division protein ZapA